MSRRLLRFACLILCSVLSVAPGAQAGSERDFSSLFGHTASPATKREFPADVERQWQRVLSTEKAEPSLALESSRLPSPEASHWLYFAGKAGRMDEMSLLRGVNVFFNRFSPRSDMENYGVEEYWATPQEFFRRRAGDCEDYALAKYFALRVFGIRDENMRLVLVHSIQEKQHHAILAVATGKGVYILDNNVSPRELILPQAQYASRFTPLYMLNEQGRWIFSKTK